MTDIRSVFIGNFSLSTDKRAYSLKNYAEFYNELVSHPGVGKVDVFAGYFLPDDPGFEFSFERPISTEIQLTLSQGNSSATKLLPFIWNNIRMFTRLTRFSLKKGNYFVFLPSPLGAWSILIVTLFRRSKSLGIYIGGYYGKEQLFEKRKGSIKRKLKRLSAFLVDKLVEYAINKSNYVITSSYEYHQIYSATGKVFLTPPLLNVNENDLTLSFSYEPENVITYCGELRHAKGVVDLLKAFSLLIRERRLSNCKLKIIGSGQALEEMIAIANADGIYELLFFCGQIKHTEELKIELGNSTIFVLPSYSEGFPRVAYECFTLGVPCVLTPVGGIPFFVVDKEHCLFVQPGNINDLADKIENLLADENLRQKLSANAKQLMSQEVFPRVRKEGSLAKMIVRMININSGLHAAFTNPISQTIKELK